MAAKSSSPASIPVEKEERERKVAAGGGGGEEELRRSLRRAAATLEQTHWIALGSPPPLCPPTSPSRPLASSSDPALASASGCDPARPQASPTACRGEAPAAYFWRGGNFTCFQPPPFKPLPGLNFCAPPQKMVLPCCALTLANKEQDGVTASSGFLHVGSRPSKSGFATFFPLGACVSRRGAH